MMTSSRPHNVSGSFASRRNNANTLSISDPSHHITETIGTLYGGDNDDDYQDNGGRPLSFMASPFGGEQITKHPDEPPSPEEHRLRLVHSISDNSDGSGPSSSAPSTNGNRRKSQLGRMPSQRSGSLDSGSSATPMSPVSPTLRDMREEDSSQFPLGNIDNPNDIAQELSNLQALRRMSMDVSNKQDPDLLPFQGVSLMAMNSIAPQGDDDEADPSRLLWVPAGVHPELAPGEFKTFLEKRVQTMKRRSGDSQLSVDSLDRSDSNGGLRRKKSMLSRQIDNAGGRGADGYVDGAERLERQNSTSTAPPELSLDELVKDPMQAVQKLTLDTSSENVVEDMPILPMAPGMGLRRSTRTTYRKGGSLKDRQGNSMRSGERLPFSKRIAARKVEGDTSEASSPVMESPIDSPKGHGLSRAQSEPVAENYSKPNRSVRRQVNITTDLADASQEGGQNEFQDRPGPRRTPSNDTARTSTSPVPQIIETPATDEEPSEPQPTQYQPRQYPERSSSQQSRAQPIIQESQIPQGPPARSSRRPNYGQPVQPPPQPQQQLQAAPNSSPNMRSQGSHNHSINDMAQHPPPLPGGATSTDSLTFIPTFSTTEEKKSEKKSKKDKGDSESTSKSWKWFKSGDDKEKKKKDEEGRKSKNRASSYEKNHDNVRLDVLQTSIDTHKQSGRQSLLLDRDIVDNKLEEERKKENNRKSSEPKKEKDGLFANFFGGSKKKSSEHERKKSHQTQRSLSPEPAPYRPLRPDVDYHWTRFPILEERAIYRMAHIKLANPRRALYSQVLLSNFMYAYLAKVQAMHPQIQVPQSPQQKRLQEEERRRREQEQQQYMEQQQAQDSIDRYNFEYHRSGNQYGDSGAQHEPGDYPEDAEVYDYGHGKDHNGNYGDYRDDRRHEDEEGDMW